MPWTTVARPGTYRHTSRPPAKAQLTVNILSMTNSLNTPIQLARSPRGEVILYADVDLWYSFRFGALQRYLTADEFHRLHESAMSFELNPLPDAARVMLTPPSAGEAPVVTLFGRLTHHDLLELKALLGRAALLVTALNRIWNDLN